MVLLRALLNTQSRRPVDDALSDTTVFWFVHVNARDVALQRCSFFGFDFGIGGAHATEKLLPFLQNTAEFIYD